MLSKVDFFLHRPIPGLNPPGVKEYFSSASNSREKLLISSNNRHLIWKCTLSIHFVGQESMYSFHSINGYSIQQANASLFCDPKVNNWCAVKFGGNMPFEFGCLRRFYGRFEVHL